MGITMLNDKGSNDLDLDLHHNNNNNNDNNNNNNRTERRNSRFFAISSLRRKLSPTSTLKWPRAQSCANHV